MKQGVLGDFVRFVYGKGLPAHNRKAGPVPVYGSAGVIDNHSTALVQGPGVVVGRKGTVGSVYWSERDFYPIDTTYYVVPIFEDIRMRYIYYLLKMLPLPHMNTDVAVPGLSRKNALRLRVTIASPPIQDRIIEVLSAYDDLIENNRRRIQLLEQAARLLYKEWFVNFRFPGYEHVTVTNGIPEGWEKKPLSEIAGITMGQSPKSVYYNEDGNGLPFHQGVTNFGVRFPSRQTYCTLQSRLAEPGDILFSVRAPVGWINITTEKIVIGRGLAAIRSNRAQQNLLFYVLKNHFFKEDMIGGGAIFAAITKKDLNGVELVQPSKQVCEFFMKCVRPIDIQIEVIHRTIDGLTRARDLLLPRLMNREVLL